MSNLDKQALQYHLSDVKTFQVTPTAVFRKVEDNTFCNNDRYTVVDGMCFKNGKFIGKTSQL